MIPKWLDILEEFKPGMTGAHREFMEKLTGGLGCDTVGIEVWDSNRNRVGRINYIWTGRDNYPSTFALRWGNKEWAANRDEITPTYPMPLWDGIPVIDRLCGCNRPCLAEDYLCSACRDLTNVS